MSDDKVPDCIKEAHAVAPGNSGMHYMQQIDSFNHIWLMYLYVKELNSDGLSFQDLHSSVNLVDKF